MNVTQSRRNRHGNVAVEYVCITAVITIAVGIGLGRLSSSMTAKLDQIPGDSQPLSQTVADGTQPAHGPVGKVNSAKAAKTNYSLVFLALAAVTAIVGTAWSMRKHHVADEEVAPGDAALTRSVAKVSRGLFNKRQQILMSISTHWHTAISSELTVADLMTTGPKCVTRDHSKDELIALMEEMNLHHTLVTDGDDLVGIISDRDLKNRDGDTAGDLMTAAPKTVAPSTRVSEAIEIILRQRFSCLPVMRGSELCGILTTSDLAMGFQCTLRVLDQIAIALGNIEAMSDVDVKPQPNRAERDLMAAYRS